MGGSDAAGCWWCKTCQSINQLINNQCLNGLINQTKTSNRRWATTRILNATISQVMYVNAGSVLTFAQLILVLCLDLKTPQDAHKLNTIMQAAGTVGQMH